MTERNFVFLTKRFFVDKALVIFVHKCINITLRHLLYSPFKSGNTNYWGYPSHPVSLAHLPLPSPLWLLHSGGISLIIPASFSVIFPPPLAQKQVHFFGSTLMSDHLFFLFWRGLTSWTSSIHCAPHILPLLRLFGICIAHSVPTKQHFFLVSASLIRTFTLCEVSFFFSLSVHVFSWSSSCSQCDWILIRDISLAIYRQLWALCEAFKGGAHCKLIVIVLWIRIFLSIRTFCVSSVCNLLMWLLHTFL